MPIRLLFLLWGFIFSKELKKLIKNLFTDSTEYKLQKEDYSLHKYLGKDLKLVLKEEIKSE